MLLLREHRILMPRVQMGQGMRTWLATSRDSSRRTTLYHTSHHWPCLADLRNPRTCYPCVHLLSHGNPRLLPTAGNALIGRVTLGHWVTTMGNSSMTCHAWWMRGEWLGHTSHHGWNTMGHDRNRTVCKALFAPSKKVFGGSRPSLGQNVAGKLW